jgi:hypothetical protein
LIWLTLGATVLLVLLLATTSRGPDGRRLWVVGPAVFAASGFHLTGHDGREAWWMALLGHHASLPLAIAILQQDYRFAFADLFLKRALALLLLATGLLAAWATAASALPFGVIRLDDPVTFAALLAMCHRCSCSPWSRMPCATASPRRAAVAGCESWPRWTRQRTRGGHVGAVGAPAAARRCGSCCRSVAIVPRVRT